MSVWGCDWSLSTGVAFAWRDAGVICALRLPVPEGCAAQRLSGLYDATVTAVDIVVRAGVPTAVYFEQAFGTNMRMLQAQGVLQAALWHALDGRTPFPPNVWPLRTTEWRQALGLPRAPDRAGRKLQQQRFAISVGAAAGLSEDEYDAVCVMVAGERDIGTGEVAA